MADLIIGVVPVFLFLVFLVYIDSYKLIKLRTVLITVAWGIISAVTAYFINTYLIKKTGISFIHYSNYVAPFLEEFIKAAILFLLIKKNKIGFLVDAGILGFSIGAGFSMVENIYYVLSIENSNFLIWVIRGFGTAIMHGGTTAILFILYQYFIHKNKFPILLFSFCLIIASSIHSLYNQFLFNPIISTMLILVIVPMFLLIIFYINTGKIKEWLEIEFDTEVNLLKMINEGKFSETRAGSYIISIKERLDNEQVFDILVFIKLYLELSIRAKGILLLKESGLEITKTDNISDKLNEFNVLKQKIGKTAFMLISPIFRINKKDIWKLNLLS